MNTVILHSNWNRKHCAVFDNCVNRRYVVVTLCLLKSETDGDQARGTTAVMRLVFFLAYV